MRKNVQYKLEDQQEVAFTTLKAKLMLLPTLAYPKPNEEIKLTCDASSVALEAVLFQTQVIKEFPISFASKILNRAEKNYSTVDREILAIFYATEKFRKSPALGRHRL